MGVSRKPKVEESLESNDQKWLLAMISIRAPLKPIYTTKDPLKKDKESSSSSSTDDDDEESCSTTPKGNEAKIKTLLRCPPAPRKPKSSLKCNYGRRKSVREFFTPPDLESAFIFHVEKERSN